MRANFLYMIPIFSGDKVMNITAPITIFLKYHEERVTDHYDADDKCMKAAIASFQIRNDQVVLRLRPFTSEVKYALSDGSEVECNRDKEMDFTYCAAKSVIKHLDAAKCVDREIVTFQARRGVMTAADSKLSGLYYIKLVDKEEFTFNFRDGIISHTYAYLYTEPSLCLFLKDTSSATVKKIEEVLINFFPKQS